jgi:hypothetical protein
MLTDPIPADVKAAQLAARRHGLLTRSQAHRCGLSDRRIAQRLRSGRWVRAGRGVYRIVGAPRTAHQEALAAVLAAGRDAVASHLTAAGLFGLVELPATPHVTVPASAGARTAGVIVHRSDLARLDRTTVGVIACTVPARTLLDVAALVSGSALERIVDEAFCSPLCSPRAVLAAMERAQRRPGRPGVAALRAAIEPWLRGIRPGSPAEVRLLRRLADWGLPGPTLQHEVLLGPGAARRVAILDVAWPEHLVGLEYDGELHHGPRQLAADVEREERLRRLGWWIGRVDRHDLQPTTRRLRDDLSARLGSAAA